MWVLPQAMEGDKEDDDGQSPWSHPALWRASAAMPTAGLCPSPHSPSILVALGAQAPCRSPARKGEGASGKARRTKKASINYSSEEVK